MGAVKSINNHLAKVLLCEVWMVYPCNLRGVVLAVGETSNLNAIKYIKESSTIHKITYLSRDEAIIYFTEFPYFLFFEVTVIFFLLLHASSFLF